jgi:hypothetical protein
VNTIKYIFTNPLGWGIAVVHWIVVAFAYLGDRPSDSFGVHAGATDLIFYLVLLDSPAIMLAKLLSSIFDISPSIIPAGLIFLIVLITLQWLLIGAGLTRIYREYHRDLPADGGNPLKFH